MNCRSLFRPNVLVNWLLIIHFVLQSNGLVHGLLEVVAAEHESASVSSQSHKDHNHHRDGSQRMSGSSEHTAGSGHMHLENRNSYSMLSAAMKQAVNHEFANIGSGSADGVCMGDDLECASIHDRLGMEAIRSLHKQLDDDENGNIDLSESDDFLREELKYDSGYEKRHKAFHYNDDMQISVKELWEAWLRSEVHNWTTEQTTDWLAQSVQLPQYVELFKQHKVNGATLPRLAVNNMHYVGNVLGIKDPIHKQKIALKAMDVVLFGPPRETGTRWKDYILVTLLLSAIIGCWYAYQQNKNAKRHLRRMVKDMEGLQKAESALLDMQKELERARMEQENVATEKLDLERRLKEAPSLTQSVSDHEIQKMKREIEVLRSQLSRAELELGDHAWTPPAALLHWLQLTYELESKSHLRKRIQAERQLLSAREACEKLKKKRTSLVGAFVSTHGKSIDEVDKSIVEARNALSEVTTELQERSYRWKQIENLLGISVVNNKGIEFLEGVLYNKNGSSKSSRARITSSQDDLDDESIQGFIDCGRLIREDSSASDDGDNQSVAFSIGGQSTPSSNANSLHGLPASGNATTASSGNYSNTSGPMVYSNNQFSSTQCDSTNSIPEEMNANTIAPQEKILTVHPRNKRPTISKMNTGATMNSTVPRAPVAPPRRTNSYQSIVLPNMFAKSLSLDGVPIELNNSPAMTISGYGDPLDDACSTDSSSFDGEFKKRRRKLHFPFGKKSSSKDKNA